MTTLLVTLVIVAVVAIVAGMVMGATKPKYQPMPVAKYDRYAGRNVNHLGENQAMWKVKAFKTRAAMDRFIMRNLGHIQYVEVFVNNGFAIEYRKLRRVY